MTEAAWLPWVPLSYWISSDLPVVARAWESLTVKWRSHNLWAGSRPGSALQQVHLFASRGRKVHYCSVGRSPAHPPGLNWRSTHCRASFSITHALLLSPDLYQFLNHICFLSLCVHLFPRIEKSRAGSLAKEKKRQSPREDDRVEGTSGRRSGSLASGQVREQEKMGELEGSALRWSCWEEPLCLMKGVGGEADRWATQQGPGCCRDGPPWPLWVDCSPTAEPK